MLVSDTATAIDCENTLLRAEEPQQQLVGIGLGDIIAVLVAHKDRAQDVKKPWLRSGLRMLSKQKPCHATIAPGVGSKALSSVSAFR